MMQAGWRSTAQFNSRGATFWMTHKRIQKARGSRWPVISPVERSTGSRGRSRTFYRSFAGARATFELHCEYWLPPSAIHGYDGVYLEHCSINIAAATTPPYALRVKHYYGINISIDITTMATNYVHQSGIDTTGWLHPGLVKAWHCRFRGALSAGDRNKSVKESHRAVQRFLFRRSSHGVASGGPQ